MKPIFTNKTTSSKKIKLIDDGEVVSNEKLLSALRYYLHSNIVAISLYNGTEHFEKEGRY